MPPFFSGFKPFSYLIKRRGRFSEKVEEANYWEKRKLEEKTKSLLNGEILASLVALTSVISSISFQNGYPSRRRSLVDDARFEAHVVKQNRQAVLEETRQKTNGENLFPSWQPFPLVVAWAWPYPLLSDECTDSSETESQCTGWLTPRFLS